MPDQTCYHCHEVSDCRPYGPGAQPVCIDCVDNFPDVGKIAEENYRLQLEAVSAMAPLSPMVVGPNGPEPLTPELLEYLQKLIAEGAQVEILAMPIKMVPPMTREEGEQ